MLHLEPVRCAVSCPVCGTWGQRVSKWSFSEVMRPSLSRRFGGHLLAVKVRLLTGEEAPALPRLAHADTAPQRLVPRAQSRCARARQVGLSAFRVRAWIHRFHRHGLAGLVEMPRSGRPRQHDETVRGTVIALARTKPPSLGLPFALWTLARLQQALHERHGRHVTPATVWKWLQAEG